MSTQPLFTSVTPSSAIQDLTRLKSRDEVVSSLNALKSSNSAKSLTVTDTSKSGVISGQNELNELVSDAARAANEESAASAKAAMEFESAESDKARAYNEYYLKNAYSWMVEGLKKAGLNPALAYSQGLNAATGNSAASGYSYSAQKANLYNKSLLIDMYKEIVSNSTDLATTAARVLPMLLAIAGA